jgi:hypothetical protein
VSGFKLDDGARTLLETQLDSVEKLEIMRALRASGQGLSTEQLESRCTLTSEIVGDTLLDLERSKFVELDASGKLVRLGQAATEPRFVALLRHYEEDRLGILSVLSSAAMQRIRSMAARTFAEAFVIRKNRGRDG